MQNIKKKAFTLVEVLFVVGIIGIVSALALPTLINNTNDKETEVLLKRAEYILKSAHEEVVTKDGRIGTQEWISAKSNYPNKLKKYLNVTADCGFTAGGRCATTNSTYNTTDYYKLKLSNGMLIFIRPYTWFLGTNYGEIYVDLDGSGKGDNEIDSDIYAFAYNSHDVFQLTSGNSLRLVSCGAQKTQVIKIVKNITGLGLGPARNLVESAPVNIFTSASGLSSAQLQAYAAQLENVGATVELK